MNLLLFGPRLSDDRASSEKRSSVDEGKSNDFAERTCSKIKIRRLWNESIDVKSTRLFSKRTRISRNISPEIVAHEVSDGRL